MRKKYLVIISLIAFALILNTVVLGTLVSQPKTQKSDGIVDNSASRITVNVMSASLNLISLSNGELTITSVQANMTTGSFVVSISNDNSSQKAITNLFVNNYSANLENDIVVPGNSSVKLLLALTDGIIFGQTYQIRLLSSEGQSGIYYEIVD